MPRIALSLLALFAVAACSDAGSGYLEAPLLTIADCNGTGHPRRFEPFHLALRELAVHDAAGAAVVRLSPSARNVEASDQIVISIRDARALAAAVKGDGSLTLALHADGTGEADLGLALLHQCKSARASLGATGTVTFEAYGARPGSIVAGVMAFDLIDRRDGSVVGSGMTGEFRLRVADPPFALHDF